ncbi:hypothetical protein Aduo_015305 [Ancylostoma duodenale]
MGENIHDWKGEELTVCRHNEYGYTTVEWLLMSVIITCSIVICVFAYLAKIYTDAHYRVNLLLEYLPSPDTVKRYNGIGESADDDKTQCRTNRSDDRNLDIRNDDKSQDVRNGDRTQETRAANKKQDNDLGSKKQDTRDGDSVHETRNDDKPQEARNGGERTQETRGADKKQDMRDSEKVQDIRVSDNSQDSRVYKQH